MFKNFTTPEKAWLIANILLLAILPTCMAMALAYKITWPLLLITASAPLSLIVLVFGIVRSWKRNG
jgi:hypothetical protein